MSLKSTDVIQSFRLRFWRESSRGATGDWRGDVWHEQQKPGDGAIPIAHPDEAFALIMNRLQGVQQDKALSPTSSDLTRTDSPDNTPPKSPKPLLLFLESIRRKLQGDQP